MALFGTENREHDVATPSSVAAMSQINMVAAGTVFEGTLRADSDVRISGRVKGTLVATSRVVVAAEGEVEGELNAANADVAGSVQGDLRVEERLVLRSSARIEGTIQTGRLIVEEGAVFNGECQMGQVGQLRKPADAPRPVAIPRRSEDGPYAAGGVASGDEPARARAL